ncbi:MAG TPA: SxtJ family membrane protein [Ignavibacteriaceae bacterium]|nr:SxtJ family membrane protein [Ignavibacteriaceae bacterium]
MSWISDVKSEIKALDLSKKKLRNFGLMVGGVFLLIAGWIHFKQIQKLPGTENYLFVYLFSLIGGVLFILGLISPGILKSVYRIWMGLAFAMGWIVSPILIMILYYIVVTPLGIAAKLFRKEFLDLKFRDNKDSYWVIKSVDSKNDYKKMY